MKSADRLENISGPIGIQQWITSRRIAVEPVAIGGTLEHNKLIQVQIGKVRHLIALKAMRELAVSLEELEKAHGRIKVPLDISGKPVGNPGSEEMLVAGTLQAAIFEFRGRLDHYKRESAELSSDPELMGALQEDANHEDRKRKHMEYIRRDIKWMNEMLKDLLPNEITRGHCEPDGGFYKLEHEKGELKKYCGEINSVLLTFFGRTKLPANTEWKPVRKALEQPEEIIPYIKAALDPSGLKSKRDRQIAELLAKELRKIHFPGAGIRIEYVQRELIKYVGMLHEYPHARENLIQESIREIEKFFKEFRKTAKRSAKYHLSDDPDMFSRERLFQELSEGVKNDARSSFSYWPQRGEWNWKEAIKRIPQAAEAWYRWQKIAEHFGYTANLDGTVSNNNEKSE